MHENIYLKEVAALNEGMVVLVRSIISFFTLLILARIKGKEQISQLTFFDYIWGITIGSVAATLTTDLSSRAWPHWVGLIAWGVLGYMMELICLKWRYAGKYLEGEPVIVIMNGKILEKVLKKTKYRISDILGLLRNKDIFNLNEVAYAIIEPNGSLSVLKKPKYLSLTPSDMKIEVKPTGIATELIYEGIIIEENLKQLNKDLNWLKKELNKHGIKDSAEVFLLTLDPSGNIYIDKYQDHIQKIIDVGDYKGPY